jgi:hypothetical protein
MAEEDSGITESPEEREARAQRDEEAKKTLEGAAAAGATGLGCLGVALMPWTVIGFILLIVLVVAWIHSCR